MTQTPMAWNAADYASNSTAQYDWAQGLLGCLRHAGSMDVLDIGCGDGRVTAEIAQQISGQVIGIDSSAQMVQLAQGRYTAANLKFRQMDATYLDFCQVFERVFSNAVMHWIQDHPSVLNGIARALKSGGLAVLSMGGKGNAAGLLPVVAEMIQREPWRNWFKDFEFPYAFYGIEEYEQWLAAAGLRARRIELVPKDMAHEHPAALKGWIRTTWLPYTDRVPEELREQFIDELVNDYLAEFPVDAFGRTHVNMIRLEVEAEKTN